MSVAAWLWIIGGLTIAGPLYLVLMIYIVGRAKRARAIALPGVASKINADYLGGDANILAQFPDGRPFYPTADVVRVTGVMRGAVGNVQATFFDLFASTPEPTSDSDNNDDQTVAMFYVGDGRLPAFQLDSIRGDQFDRHRLATPRQPVTLPQPAAGVVQVVGEDAAQIQAIFTPERCAFLAAHPFWSIQSTGAWLALCRKGELVKVRDYPRFVGEAVEFLDVFGPRG